MSRKIWFPHPSHKWSTNLSSVYLSLSSPKAYPVKTFYDRNLPAGVIGWSVRLRDKFEGFLSTKLFKHKCFLTWFEVLIVTQGSQSLNDKHKTRLIMFERVEHSSLLQLFVIYSSDKFCCISGWASLSIQRLRQFNKKNSQLHQPLTIFSYVFT